MTEGTLTLHAFIRPDTASSTFASSLISDLAGLYEFGVLGPGSKVWVNFDIPNVMWILSDRSTLLRIIDVPSAGHVRMTGNMLQWGRNWAGALERGRFRIQRSELPMEANRNDLVTVAFRNSDNKLMQAQIAGSSYPMEDYEYTHRQMRVIDFKVGREHRKTVPTEPFNAWETQNAGVRGVDLMSATTNAAMHRYIREHLEDFTSHIDIDDFGRIKAAQERILQLTDRIIDPILHNSTQLEGNKMLDSKDTDEESDAAAG